MKKEYSKPSMVREEIQVNQAIAACSGGRQGFSAEYLGWCFLNWGGAQSTKYESYEDALDKLQGNAVPDRIVKCWDVSGPRQDGSWGHVAYYEDTNRNGELDGATVGGDSFVSSDGTDHWQSVWSPGVNIETVFVS